MFSSLWICRFEYITPSGVTTEAGKVGNGNGEKELGARALRRLTVDHKCFEGGKREKSDRT